MTRITIFAGAIGSGKTEISINYALKVMQEGHEVALLDFDIVKPYIRIRDNANILRDAGLNLLMPDEKVAQADMPMIPPRIYSWIGDKSRLLVIDVGGDRQGSTTLAQLVPRMGEGNFEFILVINPYRPFTKTVEQIEEMASEVAFGARTKFHYIAANPHLKEKSNVETFMSGLEIIKEASKKMSLPIKLVAVSQELMPLVKDEDLPAPKLPLQLFVKYPWEEKPRVNWIYKKSP